MDPKRKKIYIILIAVCFSLSAAILAWSFFGSTPTVQVVPASTGGTGISNPPIVTHSVVTPVIGASGNLSSGFSAPDVFPSTNDFDTEVVDSPEFKNLTDYTGLSIQDQIGRDNPFKNY